VVRVLSENDDIAVGAELLAVLELRRGHLQQL